MRTLTKTDKQVQLHDAKAVTYVMNRCSKERLATYSMQKGHLVQHVLRKGSIGQGLCCRVLTCLALASPRSSQPCSAASDVIAIQAPPVGACLHKHIYLQIHFSRSFGSNFVIKAKLRQILTRIAVVILTKIHEQDDNAKHHYAICLL